MRASATYQGPTGTTYVLPAQYDDWEADWARYLGTTTSPLTAAERKLMGLDPRDARKAEQTPADLEAKRRHEEAVAYVRDYRGTWGLPLDIRASEKWGTKYLRLSPGQVDALLRGKERDAQQVAERSPDYDRAVSIASLWTTGGDFKESMGYRARAGERLSDRMVEVILRIDAEDREKAASVSEPGQDANGAQRASTGRTGGVAEGFYQRDDSIYKVQRNLSGTGLYAKRLIVDGGKGSWQYDPTAYRALRAEDALTVEQAAAFGRVSGICGICGRQLNDERSIANGIGPICQGKLVA